LADAKRKEDIWEYYGLSPSENLFILQLPILKGQGKSGSRLTKFSSGSSMESKEIHRTEPLQFFYLSVLEVAEYIPEAEEVFPRI